MLASSHFASAIFHARKEKHLTQAQAAELADISVRWYQQLEKGDVKPSFSICLRVSRALGIDLNRLIEEVGIDEDTVSSD